MDTLHAVLRNIRGETKSGTKAGTKSGRDHVTVFREFLQQLDRMGKKPRAGGRKRRAATRKSK